MLLSKKSNLKDYNKYLKSDFVNLITASGHELYAAEKMVPTVLKLLIKQGDGGEHDKKAKVMQIIMSKYKAFIYKKRCLVVENALSDKLKSEIDPKEVIGYFNKQFYIHQDSNQKLQEDNENAEYLEQQQQQQQLNSLGKRPRSEDEGGEENTDGFPETKKLKHVPIYEDVTDEEDTEEVRRREDKEASSNLNLYL